MGILSTYSCGVFLCSITLLQTPFYLGYAWQAWTPHLFCRKVVRNLMMFFTSCRMLNVQLRKLLVAILWPKNQIPLETFYVQLLTLEELGYWPYLFYEHNYIMAILLPCHLTFNNTFSLLLSYGMNYLISSLLPCTSSFKPAIIWFYLKIYQYEPHQLYFIFKLLGLF